MLETKVDSLRQRGLNPYQAAIMAAKEARDINEKVLQSIIEIEEKPTTVALQKLLDGRVVLAEDETIEG